MRKAWFLLFGVFFFAGCAVDEASDDGEAQTSDDTGETSEEALTTGMLDAEEIAFLGQINAYRVANGLAKLHVSIALTRASDAHSVDMAAHMKMQHDSFD